MFVVSREHKILLHKTYYTYFAVVLHFSSLQLQLSSPHSTTLILPLLQPTRPLTVVQPAATQTHKAFLMAVPE